MGKKLLHLLEDIVSFEVPEDSIAERAIKEVQRYESEDQESNCDPLEWWKSASGRYPLLSQLARKYLSVVATSVPPKRAFSTAGHIVNEKRACFLPENVSMLVFLAANLKYIVSVQ